MSRQGQSWLHGAPLLQDSLPLFHLASYTHNGTKTIALQTYAQRLMELRGREPGLPSGAKGLDARRRIRSSGE